MESTTLADDGVFKVTIGPAMDVNPTTNTSTSEMKQFQPLARINCGLAIKYGNLYMYGGMYEDGSKQITLQDFYALDLKKLDEWKVIIDDDKKQEWLGSDSESDEELDSEEEDTDSTEDL